MAINTEVKTVAHTVLDSGAVSVVYIQGDRVAQLHFKSEGGIYATARELKSWAEDLLKVSAIMEEGQK